MSSEIPFVDVLRAELTASDVPAISSSRRSRSAIRLSGPTVALATFILVLVGGLAIWLTGRGAPSEFAQPDMIEWDLEVLLWEPEDPGAIVAEAQRLPEVVEIQYLRDASALYPDMSSTAGSLGAADQEAPRIAALLVRLRDDADPSVVAVRLAGLESSIRVSYSPDLVAERGRTFYETVLEGAIVLSEDPWIIQPAPPAEPAFDTSSLGQQVQLERVLPDDSGMESLSREEGLFPLEPDKGMRRDDDRPIVNIGRLSPGPGETITSHLVLYPTRSGGYYIAVLRDAGVGAAYADFREAGFFGVAAGGSGSGASDYVEVVVPLYTSVVTLTSEADGSMWQRPVAGWALFPVASAQADFVVTAYDESGTQIGRWQTS